MTSVLEARGIGKVFRTGGGAVEALGGVDLTVPRGAVYGLLGPNGAGKSTLLRITLGLIRATRGTCRLLGAEHADARTMRKVGALIEAPSLYPFFTGRETLQLLAKTSGFDEAGRIDALLARVGLTDAANRRVKSYSLGMKQRLGVAAALLARPELLILDEPTNGLDPAGIQEMRALVRDLADRDGITVLLSSHLMDEVQKICDRVAILNLGRMVAEGAVKDLLAVGGRLMLHATPAEKALGVLGARAQAVGDMIAADVERVAAPGVVRELVAAGCDVHEVRWSALTLEELFLSMTARR